MMFSDNFSDEFMELVGEFFQLGRVVYLLALGRDINRAAVLLAEFVLTLALQIIHGVRIAFGYFAHRRLPREKHRPFPQCLKSVK
jgi:predicted alpha/beta-hydrolase family hydrolase